jgi:LCP family protein required for cell wall assembly
VTVAAEAEPSRGTPPGVRPRRRRRSRPGTRSVLLVTGTALLGLLLVLVLTLAAGGVWLGSRIERIPGGVFTDVPAATRPEREPGVDERGRPVSATGITFLLAGTDRRSDVATTGSDAAAPAWRPGAQRTDALMLLHLTADGERAYVVSVPRDSWVAVPGHGKAKVNAAFSYGGPALMVRTVEELTDVRIDHVAVVDWNGLSRLVDAVGGVELTFESRQVGWGREWAPGTHRLDGAAVIAYVGERYRLPRGDLDRIERQQQVLRALAERLLTTDVLADPARALAVAGTVTRSVSVDEELDADALLSLARRVSGLRLSDVTYATAPVAGLGTRDRQSVVLLDEERLAGFFRAVETDRLEQWLQTEGTQP